MDTLVKKAYDNWMHVIEYDSKSLLSTEPQKSDPQIDVSMASQDYSHSFDQQFGLPAPPVPVPLERPSMDSGLTGIYSSIESCYIARI